MIAGKQGRLPAAGPLAARRR